MANLTFTSDLLADILFRAGEPTSGTSDFNAVALIYLNRAYQALVMGGGEVDAEINEDWWWAKKQPPGVINLESSYTSGTVSVTNNSASITLSAVVAGSRAGWFFRVEGHSDIFRVIAHTGGTAAMTLDAPFTGSTNAATTYRLFKAEYDLASDVLKVMSPMRVYQGTLSEVDGVELMALERDWPLRDINAGPPLQFALSTESKVRFSHYGPPDTTSVPNLIRLEYDYIARPPDLTSPGTTEEPIVPKQYRKILSDIALTFLFVDKNDDRASMVSGLAKKGLNAMMNEQRSRMVRYSRTFGKLNPRPGQMTTWRHPLRTESGFILG